MEREETELFESFNEYFKSLEEFNPEPSSSVIEAFGSLESYCKFCYTNLRNKMSSNYKIDEARYRKLGSRRYNDYFGNVEIDYHTEGFFTDSDLNCMSVDRLKEECLKLNNRYSEHLECEKNKSQNPQQKGLQHISEILFVEL